MKKFCQILIVLLTVFLLVFLTGCLKSFEPIVEINEGGSGTVRIEVMAYSEIDDQIQKVFSGKNNLQINKTKSDDYYKYNISFDFNDIKEVSKKASFTAEDKFDRIIYKYDDLISAKDLTGETSLSLTDFKYCIRLPGKVTEFIVGNIKDQTYNGSTIACTNIESDSESTGKIISLATEKLKEGCTYNNPPCQESYECISNQCVKKQGCAYNNPFCTENYDCINNKCVLKKGCLYNNPSCNSNQNCINNECILKKGCEYNNPDCNENQTCTNNQCTEKPSIYAPLTTFLIIKFSIIILSCLILAGAIFWVYQNSKKKRTKK